ncbi:MAG: ATP--guanido phosphotransferase [Candidatus Sumerlaeia bacterium]|nr:ATP--guanido phosphotransferase [Candidatus Sumerlaeia bacterium]
MTASPIFERSDRWLEMRSPLGHTAVSTRARFARNLTGFPFAPHARADVLERIERFLGEAVGRAGAFRDFERLDLASLSVVERKFLKESRLISKEMETGTRHCGVYVSPDTLASILVNEEDHVRVQVLAPGLALESAVERLSEMDRALGEVVGYAWSEHYGYLTACPTNVGTGFRASVMLHLPGLAMLSRVDAALQGVAQHGMTVRGFYGENTEYAGDFYQVSNEVTLGRTVESLVEDLRLVLLRVVEREEEARIELFRHHAVPTRDAIWRSYALLSHAVRMESAEAMRHLSRLRLGIDQRYFRDLDHHDLNRLVVEIQPAHLELRRLAQGETLSRDELRAAYLRARIHKAADEN